MERKNWIDVLRGMAMLIVIMGHSIGFTDNPINRMILCFHMLLFYFISGLTFTPSKYISLRNAVKAKFLGICLQYLCFSVLGIMLYYVIAFLGLQEKSQTVNLLRAFIGVFYPDGRIGSLVTMGFWFVYDIIIIDLTCLAVYYALKTRNFKFVIIPIIYIVSMSLANLDVMLRQTVGFFFFIVGKLTMNKIQNIENANRCHSGGGKNGSFYFKPYGFNFFIPQFLL